MAAAAGRARRARPRPAPTARRSRAAGERMARLVDDLLDLARHRETAPLAIRPTRAATRWTSSPRRPTRHRGGGGGEGARRLPRRGSPGLPEVDCGPRARSSRCSGASIDGRGEGHRAQDAVSLAAEARGAEVVFPRCATRGPSIPAAAAVPRLRSVLPGRARLPRDAARGLGPRRWRGGSSRRTAARSTRRSTPGEGARSCRSPCRPSPSAADDAGDDALRAGRGVAALRLRTPPRASPREARPPAGRWPSTVPYATPATPITTPSAPAPVTRSPSRSAASRVLGERRELQPDRGPAHAERAVRLRHEDLRHVRREAHHEGDPQSAGEPGQGPSANGSATGRPPRQK